MTTAGFTRGRVVVATTWAAAAALHARNGLVAVDGVPGLRLLDASLIVAAVVGVALLFVAGGQRSLLFAAVTGAAGVAVWFAPLVVPGLAGPRVDLWSFGAALLDGLTVRLAVFNLRRVHRASQR